MTSTRALPHELGHLNVFAGAASLLIRTVTPAELGSATSYRLDLTKEQAAHPGRNDPGFVHALLYEFAGYGPTHHSSCYAPRIWDPQCGTGSTMELANRLGHYSATGWDIEPRWRDTVDPARLLEHPETGSVDLVITSPTWFGNKDPGKGQYQEEQAKLIGSAAGTEWGDTQPRNLANAKDWGQWALMATGVLRKIHLALRPGTGRLVWIIRDIVQDNKLTEFPVFNANLIEMAGFRVFGAYHRELTPTAQHQRRAAKMRKDARDPKLHVQFPEKEFAIVAKALLE